MSDYKNTLNLPRTDFPMKANLPQREPELLKRWAEQNVYGLIRAACKGKPGVCYPPSIITTADHDDRVVPSHSYKFAATMQHDQGCANPVLIHIETQTSHGYMPTDKRIAQWSSVWAFLAYNLGITRPPAQN